MNSESRFISSCLNRSVLHTKRINISTPPENTMLQHRIEITDKQINELVYERYDLTDEEIKIVEQDGK